MSDVFGIEWHPRSETQKILVGGVKELAESLHRVINGLPASDRGMIKNSLDRLEESIGWAIRAID